MKWSDRLAVRIGDVVLQNPVWVGSSELSLTEEGIARLAGFAPGAIVAKSVNESAEARRNLSKARYLLLTDAREEQGTNPALDAALFNRSGLAPVELGKWCRTLARARRVCSRTGVVLIGSVTVGDATQTPAIVRELSEAVGHVEVNVGAPHAREISTGSITNILDPARLGDLVRECRSHCGGLLIIKLPRSGHIGPALVRAAFAQGADAVALEGRSPGLMVDPRSGAPLLETAGAFGSSHDLPLSLYAVAKAAELAGQLGRPLIGTNGARTGEDIMRFVLCGATAVEIVSALVIRGPGYLGDLLRDLERCAESFGERSLSDLVGLSHELLKSYADDDLEKEDFESFLGRAGREPIINSPEEKPGGR